MLDVRSRACADQVVFWRRYLILIYITYSIVYIRMRYQSEGSLTLRMSRFHPKRVRMSAIWHPVQHVERSGGGHALLLPWTWYLASGSCDIELADITTYYLRLDMFNMCAGKKIRWPNSWRVRALWTDVPTWEVIPKPKSPWAMPGQSPARIVASKGGLLCRLAQQCPSCIVSMQA